MVLCVDWMALQVDLGPDEDEGSYEPTVLACPLVNHCIPTAHCIPNPLWMLAARSQCVPIVRIVLTAAVQCG